MKLQELEINGFKSIKSQKLRLDNLNVLIGANGSGKSNFIHFFKLINQILDQNLQVYIGSTGGADSYLYFGRKHTKSVSFYLSFGTNGYQAKLIPTSENNLIFEEEWVLFHDRAKYPHPYKKFLGGGHKETILKERAQSRGGIPKFVIKAIESWRIYHFHDTSDSSKIKQAQPINDNMFFKPDASNLAAFLYFLMKKHPSHYEVIVKTVQMVAPFFKDFDLHPSALNEAQIQLDWRHIGTDNFFSAYSLSDGTLRFICLATLLLQPNPPSIILLDEPELGLHPFAVNLLASLLKSASKKVQVIASTQSVTLINQFEPANIIVVDREHEESVFRHLAEADLTTWLDDYGIGDLWEKNIIGGRPK